MLISERELQHYKIGAMDGEVGEIHDLYFDDHYWTVRYIVVDTGHWLTGRRVLISAKVAGQPQRDSLLLPVNMTREKIENSPPTSFDKPVSEQHQIELHAYYGWPIYWGGSMGPNGPYPYAPYLREEMAGAEGGGTSAFVEESKGDPHLRSSREVKGYHLEAHGEGLGHVEDFLIDSELWELRYLVIDTRNWLPGKKVLVPVTLIQSVDWFESKVIARVNRDRIKNSPEYDPARALSVEYQIRLREYYRNHAETG